MKRSLVIVLTGLLLTACGQSETTTQQPDAATSDVTDAASDSGQAAEDAGNAGNNEDVPDASTDAETADASTDTGAPAEWNILLFSRTEGFRHGSIPDALDAIRTRAEAQGHTVTASEETNIFTDDGLAEFDVVVFVMTTGDILDEPEQGAFERWVNDGGGWAGIHSASDTEYDWAWYGGLVGAYFDNHPSIQEAELDVEIAAHLSTSHLPATWTRRDEWYNFSENPRANVTVLLTIDESTYNGGSMGDDHPMAWCHDYDGGRSWYTAGGHTNASYSDDDFMAHVMGGIAYAAGEGSCP